MREAPAMMVTALVGFCIIGAAAIRNAVGGEENLPAASAVAATRSALAPSEELQCGTPARIAQSGARPRNLRELIQQASEFKTDVPVHDLDVVLVRPADRSIEITLAASANGTAVVETWRDGVPGRKRAGPVQLKPREIAHVVLGELAPSASYRYRVGLENRAGQAGGIEWKEESSFHTRRSPGTPFTFTIQADSHLDQGVEPMVYEQTLANMHAASPDFVIDLGDTFMTDKRGHDFKSALAQYDAQRYYFGLVAHSAPLFMVLGNHDGESGTSGTRTDDIGPWSYVQRSRRFPPPLIDGVMYTGATGMTDGIGANYYAFEWGDALCVVLDPYWSTTARIRGGGGGGNRGAGERGPAPRDGQGSSVEPLKPVDSSWTSTLGRQQYDWLQRTLEGTKARYRFVFIHHLVGGLGGSQSRGGAESSPYFEWGGRNADGSPGFAAHRPGWPMPVHELLVKHKVQTVFHGHDHLYVHSQRDGVVYQCVPQPGNPRGNTRTAGEYGYSSGTLHGSPGHLRVRVTAGKTDVEFVRTTLADPRSGSSEAGKGQGSTRSGGRGGGRAAGEVGANGSLVHSFTIAPVGTPLTVAPK